MIMMINQGKSKEVVKKYKGKYTGTVYILNIIMMINQGKGK